MQSFSAGFTTQRDSTLNFGTVALSLGVGYFCVATWYMGSWEWNETRSSSLGSARSGVCLIQCKAPRTKNLNSILSREALFFLVTTIMIVLGLVAIDKAIAIAEYQIASSPGTAKQFLPLRQLVLLHFYDQPEFYNFSFLQGVDHAVQVVSQRSQSFYMGSA